jgi:hypothetical protein
LTQGFFAYLIEKRAYAEPDRSKGRFRTFLLTLLKRYLGAARHHQCRQKRGGGKPPLWLEGGQLNALERECGGRLFQRTGRGVVLTALGQRVAPKVRGHRHCPVLKGTIRPSVSPASTKHPEMIV